MNHTTNPHPGSSRPATTMEAIQSTAGTAGVALGALVGAGALLYPDGSVFSVVRLGFLVALAVLAVALALPKEGKGSLAQRAAWDFVWGAVVPCVVFALLESAMGGTGWVGRGGTLGLLAILAVAAIVTTYLRWKTAVTETAPPPLGTAQMAHPSGNTARLDWTEG